ncbi:MAG: hypothetical protein Q8K63_12390 [Acidimicrobiales bacterium]|nr:hypothetical protein [Acidimicrobiales bacterium]
MTVTSAPSDGANASPTQPPLALADGLDLVGEFEGSGFIEAPSIVRLASGQTIQLTELLYVVLESIDGTRSNDEIAALVSERIGKQASAENIAYLAEEKLRPLGVLKNVDGSNPEVAKSDPLLGIKGRFTLASERTTNALAAPFQPLFWPPVMVAVLAAFVAMAWWLFFAEGLAQGTRELLYSPGMLVLTFALTAASAGFHEFGHAAACRAGGAKPGIIGGGVYLVWPVFFTDVTDSYRLSKAARIRTDLGGLYFNTVFCLATVGVWSVTRYDPLLVLVPLQMFQMTQQLMPFVRFDGYYILADLTGVPDLFARIKPTLESAVPGRPTTEPVKVLKPWVRVVVTAWVVIVIPVLLVSLGFAVFGLPRLLATVWDSLGRQWEGVTNAAGDGDWLRMIAGVLASAAVALPAASIIYILSRIVRRAGASLRKRTDGRPIARAALGPLGLVAAVALAWLWWPNGEYRPLQKGERWTVQETVGKIRDVPSGRPGVATLDDQDVVTTTTVAPPTSTTVVDEDDEPRTATTRRESGSAPDTDDESSPSTTTATPTTVAAETTETTTP